jgi:hypothetical protein
MGKRKTYRIIVSRSISVSIVTRLRAVRPWFVKYRGDFTVYRITTLVSLLAPPPRNFTMVMDL